MIILLLLYIIIVPTLYSDILTYYIVIYNLKIFYIPIPNFAFYPCAYTYLKVLSSLGLVPEQHSTCCIVEVMREKLVE